MYCIFLLVFRLMINPTQAVKYDYVDSSKVYSEYNGLFFYRKFKYSTDKHNNKLTYLRNQLLPLGLQPRPTSSFATIPHRPQPSVAPPKTL